MIETEWPEVPEENSSSDGTRWDMKRKAARFLNDFATEVNDADGIERAMKYLKEH